MAEINSTDDKRKDITAKTDSGKKETKSSSSSSVPLAMPTKPLSPRDLIASASPPKFINLEDGLRLASGVNDMALAHEIAVSNEFRFQTTPTPDNSIVQKVKEVMHKAFWDVLEDKLKEDPPDYSQALLLLQEVKENLLELLLPQHQRIRENIEEVLDMQLIEQKAEHGILDIMYYANYVIGIMARLCAPIRDEQIDVLKQLTGIVPIYKEIFNVLNLMKLDMVNFTIDAVRPYVQQHSVTYEREKFNELLKVQRENGIDGLQFTKIWLSRIASKLKSQEETCASSSAASAPTASSSTASPSTASSGSEMDKKRYNKIMNAAYMELLEWDELNDVFPETLLVDQQRFLELRNRVGYLVLISSVLIVTYNTVGQAISGIARLKQELKTQIEILTNGTTERQLPEMITSVAEQVNKVVNDCLGEHSFRQLTEDEEKLLKGQIAALITPNNSIFKLMKTRLFTFIATAIVNPRDKNIQVPAGFGAVSEEIGQICGQFLRLINYNQAVFGSHYADLIREFSPY